MVVRVIFPTDIRCSKTKPLYEYEYQFAICESCFWCATIFHKSIIILQIFSINGTKLAEIRERQFPLESEIQSLTEANLHDLFELDFVKSEFELHGLRIDTLAFDNESKAFVIIEYKKDRNFSVVDQGMAYLNLMLNNKADFILSIMKAQIHPIV